MIESILPRSAAAARFATLAAVIAVAFQCCAADGNTVSAESVAPAATSPSGDGVAAVAKTAPVRFQLALGSAEGQRFPDSALRVVSPAYKSLDIGLLIVGALVGSFRLPTAKEDYKGSSVDTVKHPVYADLMKGLHDSIEEWRIAQGAKAYENPVSVRPDTFALVYTEYGAEKPTYDLVIETTVFRKADSAGWLAAPAVVHCQDAYSDPALTLEQWEADDYAAVKAKGREHTRTCIDRVKAEFARLFAD